MVCIPCVFVLLAQLKMGMTYYLTVQIKTGLVFDMVRKSACPFVQTVF